MWGGGERALELGAGTAGEAVLEIEGAGAGDEKADKKSSSSSG